MNSWWSAHGMPVYFICPLSNCIPLFVCFNYIGRKRIHLNMKCDKVIDFYLIRNLEVFCQALHMFPVLEPTWGLFLPQVLSPRPFGERDCNVQSRWRIQGVQCSASQFPEHIEMQWNAKTEIGSFQRVWRIYWGFCFWICCCLFLLPCLFVLIFRDRFSLGTIVRVGTSSLDQDAHNDHD